MKISAHLHFKGNCREAFAFYQSIIGGEITMMMPHAGTPAEGAFGPEWADKIIHAELQIGNDTLMGADAPPQYQEGEPAGFSVSLLTDTPEEADRIFAGLSEGGTVTMPIEETFWAHRFGMVTDQFGMPWMVNCEKPLPA